MKTIETSEKSESLIQENADLKQENETLKKALKLACKKISKNSTTNKFHYTNFICQAKKELDETPKSKPEPPAVVNLISIEEKFFSNPKKI